MFPGLFNIATNKNASIADNRECLNGSAQWNVTFICRVRDWEVEVLASFYMLQYSHTMCGEGEDRMWWIPSRKGKLEVRSFYRILASKDFIPFPWKSIWRTKAPSRVTFFAWTAALGKTLTLDNVWKRGIVVINQCCMCELEGESIDHLFLHCGVAGTL